MFEPIKEVIGEDVDKHVQWLRVTGAASALRASRLLAEGGGD